MVCKAQKFKLSSFLPTCSSQKDKKRCIIFLQTCFYFREQRTSYFSPFESMDLLITGRKLSTVACLAFERYCVQERIINLCSSVKCKFCRNRSLISLKSHKETRCSLQLKTCFCRDILPPFSLVRICTSTSKQYTSKNFAGLLHMYLKFLILVEKKF